MTNLSCRWYKIQNWHRTLAAPQSKQLAHLKALATAAVGHQGQQ